MASFAPSLSRLRVFALTVLVAFSWRQRQVLSVTDAFLEIIAIENLNDSKGHNIFAQRSMSNADNDEDVSTDAGRGISANAKDGDFTNPPDFSVMDADAPPVSNGGGDVPPVSEDDVDAPPVSDNGDDALLVSDNGDDAPLVSDEEAVRDVTSVTTGLYVPGKIEIVFYDWDTLVDANFAGKVLLMCDPAYDYAETGCDGADSCTGPNSLSDTLLGQENPEEFVTKNAWGGQERLERIERHWRFP